MGFSIKSAKIEYRTNSYQVLKDYIPEEWMVLRISFLCGLFYSRIEWICWGYIPREDPILSQISWDCQKCKTNSLNWVTLEESQNSRTMFLTSRNVW